ncbi:chloride conductance regulatory protein ICln-like [Ananas comosus]|uniref:Chloride conductance regulatory protein ICln n=1 Tax=Ananas comosus TaxID=4615 RepID=A0A199VC00_ANACO|nr:chloride conductance regulatory protein ICln-like [Ananas comosus]OAY74619.1 Chloride conductance regulatory protein ICln [Ananas comosus]
MVVGLRPFDDRVGDGPRLDADSGEEVMRVERGVAVALGRRPMESPGTLFVTTKRVIWLSDVDKEKGYAVDFLSISLHAVSRDPEAYPVPCIFAQIETGNDGNDVEGSDSEFGQDTDLSRITEMRLMLSDSNQLDALFDIFCQCAELNPDPNSVSGEENSWVFGNEEIGDGSYPEWQTYESLANPIGYANGAHDLAHSVLELQINDQRFEDAEEVEHDTNGDHQ